MVDILAIEAIDIATVKLFDLVYYPIRIRHVQAPSVIYASDARRSGKVPPDGQGERLAIAFPPERTPAVV
jgi:hypothetical protein